MQFTVALALSLAFFVSSMVFFFKHFPLLYRWKSVHQSIGIHSYVVAPGGGYYYPPYPYYDDNTSEAASTSAASVDDDEAAASSSASVDYNGVQVAAGTSAAVSMHDDGYPDDGLVSDEASASSSSSADSWENGAMASSNSQASRRRQYQYSSGPIQYYDGEPIDLYQNYFDQRYYNNPRFPQHQFYPYHRYNNFYPQYYPQNYPQNYILYW